MREGEAAFTCGDLCVAETEGADKGGGALVVVVKWVEERAAFALASIMPELVLFLAVTSPGTATILSNEVFRVVVVLAKSTVLCFFFLFLEEGEEGEETRDPPTATPVSVILRLMRMVPFAFKSGPLAEVVVVVEGPPIPAADGDREDIEDATEEEEEDPFPLLSITTIPTPFPPAPLEAGGSKDGSVPGGGTSLFRSNASLGKWRRESKAMVAFLIARIRSCGVYAS